MRSVVVILKRKLLKMLEKVDQGAVFSMDGNNGMGSTIGSAAMKECIRRARQYVFRLL